MKKKLLVIDDIPAVKDFIINALSCDYDVMGVNSGSEALEVLSNSPHDLVILGEQDQSKALVGNSVQLQHIREKIQVVAGTGATVLITGESGVGKEVVADEVQRQSGRDGEPYIKVNCASIPSKLLDVELFGSEKRSHVGETHVERGKFELADNGTILLDEIGGLSPSMQVRLLSVIQEGRFERVGGRIPVKVNVRIIATTNLNLKEEIRQRRFREDLYYRLNVVPLEIPPLRDRREDIPLLINHFVNEFAAKYNTDPVSLNEVAIEKLCNAYWKGNVRQLRSIIERSAILRGGVNLDADHFHFENDREEQLSLVEQAFRFGTIREMEKLMILNRLKDNGENRTRSAETLDISVRTLRNKLHEYNVPKKRQQASRIQNLR